MNPLIQLNRQLQYLFIALLLACFAIAQSARAVTPEADEGDPNANTAEENNGRLDLGSGTGNGAMDGVTMDEGMARIKKGANHPRHPKQPKQPNQPNQDNHKVISVKLTTDFCGCDRVELNGELHMQFRVSEFPFLGRGFGPADLKLENFRAKPLVTSREYKADNPEIVQNFGEINQFPNGVGAGEISVGFVVTGRPRLTSDACPKSIIKFLVTYRVVYGWKVLKNGKQEVTRMTPDGPKVKCFTTPAP